MIARSGALRRPRGGDPVLRQGLFKMVKGLLMFEAVLYAVITPLLPHYARQFGASKAQIGVLAAAYAAGLIPGSLIAGLLAARAGVRRTTALGLLVFALSTAAFGFGSSLLALDLLRALEGVACGLIWGGALTWVIAVAPRERRGELLGSVVAAAIIGTLIGPVVGTVAGTAGTGVTFTIVGVVSLMLAVRVITYPEPPALESTAPPSSRPRGNRTLWLGAWLVMLGAGLFGAMNALIPLRLAHFGASSVTIGATFFMAAAVDAAIASGLGRLTDRAGAARPICGGLLLAALLVAGLPLPASVLALAVLSAVAMSGPVTAWMVPAASWMTDSAEQIGMSLIVATMLFNLAYALGETIGAPSAAALAQAGGDGLPFLLLSATMLLSLIAVVATTRHRSPARVEAAMEVAP